MRPQSGRGRAIFNMFHQCLLPIQDNVYCYSHKNIGHFSIDNFSLMNTAYIITIIINVLLSLSLFITTVSYNCAHTQSLSIIHCVRVCFLVVQHLHQISDRTHVDSV